jgi:Zn finger protein HypA/HybF involved in hydrogenase expression
MKAVEDTEKQREYLSRIIKTNGRGKRQWLKDQAKAFGAIQCPCGHVFESSLGKYGCPNCEGEAVK